MKKILNILIIIGVLIPFTSCKKFLNINKDPDAPTTVQIKDLLTYAELYLGIAFSQDNYLGNELEVFVHRNSIRESADRYATLPSQNGYGNSWSELYAYVIPAVDEIIALGEKDGNLEFVGIAKVLKAHVYSNLVDLWGNVPFSEANNPSEFQFPHLDNGEAVYNNCFTLLQEAKAAFAATASNTVKPGTADLIYKGDKAKWVALANSLILRLCNNTKNVQSKITGWSSLLAEAVAGPRITAAMDFQFPFSNVQTPSDERYPAYTQCYGTTQHTNYPSPWLYEMMQGYAAYNMPDNPFSGVKDPRITYYFYNQVAPAYSAANPTCYRDGAFISLFFGDNSAGAGSNVTPYATVWGVYPVGGKFDDGSATRATAGAGANGKTPQKLFTYADLKFIEAELILNGNIPGDAQATYLAAVTAALTHLNNTSKGLGGAPATGIAAAAINTFITSLQNKYVAAADNTKRLEMIISQKWIHDVMNGFESYTDVRRTGFPKLYNADVPGYGISPISPDGLSTDAHINTNCGRPYPNSLWYTQAEVDRNENVTQKENQSVKVFWQL